MSKILRYITHPQVKIDPSVPVPNWGLSELGRQRAETFARLPFLSSTASIISSAETKAVETANIISAVLDAPIFIREKTHENDRSATGFLKPKEFEEVADQFFATPEKSVRGWERAIDVQSRIVSQIKSIVDEHTHGDLLVVGHGAVGTILYCNLADVGISRAYDQPGGGGNMFSYDLDARTVQHSWKSIEQLTDNYR